MCLSEFSCMSVGMLVCICVRVQVSLETAVGLASSGRRLLPVLLFSPGCSLSRQ